VTSISQQGIESLLPGGWSPMAAVDIAPHGVTFSGGASLTTPSSFTLAAGTPLVLATWDEQAEFWRAVAAAPIGSDGLTLQASVQQSGEYAWLLADTTPAAPPTPAAGDVLSGFAPSAIPGAATAVVDPQPRILFYKPGVQSEVRGRVTTTTPLVSSASLAQTQIVESYNFRSGDQIHTTPYVEDLVVYQLPGTPTTLWAGYPVTPSLTFDPVTLDNGVITVTLQTRPDGGTPITEVPSTGGTVSSPAGQAAQFAPGASTVALPASVQPLALSDTGLTLPSTLSFVDGLLVTFPGTLGAPLVLSVAQPTSVSTADQLLFVRAQEIGGSTRLLLVALGKIVNGQIVSDTAIAGTPGVLDGPLVGGRYLVLKATNPIGFEAGNVFGTDGTPFTGALVSSSSLPIVALSKTTGRYVNVTGTGAVFLTALDLQRSDSGTGSATITSPGSLVALDLKLLSQVPAVLSVTPANGTSNVVLSSAIVATFSEGIDPTTVNGTSAGNVKLIAADGTVVTGTINLNSTNTTLTFRPAPGLASNVQYTLTLAQGIANISGRTLAAPFKSSFTSMNTAPPPTPPAGAITATIPDSHGNTTVNASQGSADVHDTVTVLNLTTGTTTPVILNPNGGFSTLVVAQPTDKLRVQIVDPNGNGTTVDLPRFQQTNADGSLSVVLDSTGGHIDGPGGTAVDVVDGTFPNGAVVTINQIPLANFPVQLTPDQAQNFDLIGAIQLDFGGAEPQHYVNVSVPAAPTDLATDQWLVTQVVPLNGQQLLNVVDTAKLINGRVATSSPPCPGVTAASTYGLLKSKQTYGLNFATMYAGGRYRLSVQIQTFSLGSPVAIPYTVLSAELPTPICFPVISGRVTVVPNSSQISVHADQLTPADREIRVKNTTRGTEQSYPRSFPPYDFQVKGSGRDFFSVVAVGPGGQVDLGQKFKIILSNAEVNDPGFFDTSTTIEINPDDVTVPTTSFSITDLTAKTGAQTFPITVAPFVVAATGGAGDQYQVNALPSGILALLKSRSVLFDVIPSPFGTGNLVAKAIPGTIDPTRAEMNAAGVSGPARTGVEISGGGVDVVIPDAQIVQGGFAYAFSGDPAATYDLIVHYDSRPDFVVELPRFQITVQNTITGEVVETLAGQSPPRDQPLDLGTITDDTSPPVIVSGPQLLANFDPEGLISFTFSKGLQPATVKAGLIVTDSHGVQVPGTVNISSGDTVATFVPSTPLKLGEQYTVTLLGGSQAGAIKDFGGNSIQGIQLPVMTFKPQVIGSFVNGNNDAMKDIAYRRTKIDAQTTKTTLFVTTGGSAQNLISVDATNPKKPVFLGADAFAEQSRQRVTLAQGTTFSYGSFLNKQTFTGDLAITSTFNTSDSLMSFVDVTVPTSMNVIGGKLLTRNPDQFPAPAGNDGVTYDIGYAKGVTSLQTTTGLAAYVAIERIGVIAADVGSNVPQQPGKLPSATYPGDFTDIVSYRGNGVVAVGRSGTNNLVVLDPNLAPQADPLGLPTLPRRLRVVTAVPIDINGDGQITPDEILDLAVIAADGAVQFVKLGDSQQRVGDGNGTAPMLIGRINIPGTVRDVEVDLVHLRAIAAVDQATGGPALYFIDMSRPLGLNTIDNDHDGFDDRIVLRLPSSPVNGMRLDVDRGLLYVGTPSSLDIWQVYDNCCDLGVDTAGQPFIEPAGATQEVYTNELNALKKGIVQGLDTVVANCFNGDITKVPQMTLIEAGSSACLWRPNSKEVCGSNYQPGVSDHDISTLMPDAWYSIMVPNPNKTGWSGLKPDAAQNPNIAGDDPITQSHDQRPDQILLAQCVTDGLTTPFTDFSDPDLAPIDIDGFKFGDISFLSNFTADLQSARYRLARTVPGEGDVDNDLGLGRQLLLFKYLV
ncbi:MAG TPA: Ig-like domain-containing protein, partial [Vicinamibacterales bacterium]|nr:Ig-like domain-containing protein [Vicinamibacterales bacterium]